MPPVQLQRFVDRGQHPVGGVGCTRDVSVRQDREKLRRGPAQDAWRVDVSDGAGQRRGHHLQRLFRRAGPVRLDQEDAEVALITVRPRQLILENRTDKTIVEEPGCPVHYVERFGLGIVGAHPARWAEHSAVGQRGPASQARLCFRPPAQEIANRHCVKAYQPSGRGLGIPPRQPTAASTVVSQLSAQVATAASTGSSARPREVRR